MRTALADATKDDPDAALVTMEREPEGLLVRRQRLRAAWPKAPHALQRARIGCEVDETLARIGELEEEIARTPAHRFAGAAVQLRRLSVLLEGGDARARGLLASALVAVEAGVFPASRAPGVDCSHGFAIWISSPSMRNS